MKQWIGFIVLSILLTACGNAETEKKETSQPEIVLETGLTIEPILKRADSVQLLYFKNPFGDSLRYTRFYTYHVTNDTSLINDLVNQMDKNFQVQPTARTCRSNGKLFFYGAGNELKTVYFATQGKDCSYLYYIKNGMFYYFTIDEATEKRLIELKAKTVEP
jgi:hypothetical protein